MTVPPQTRPAASDPAVPAGVDRPGALVLSLDLELHWGVRDRVAPEDPYAAALLGARQATEEMLSIFEAYGVAATWATVGFLYATSRAELERASPSLRPLYQNQSLDPYGERVGADEADDPLHLAPSLIRRIASTPLQEIGTHTFSHYYCGEPGTTPITFREDLKAAQRIERSAGVSARSIVFPRNQAHRRFLDVLPELGIDVYRGNPAGGLWSAEGAHGRRLWRRVGRLVDAYLPIAGDDTVGWEDIPEPDGLANVRASRFLRPVAPSLATLDPLRLRRIRRGLRKAARDHRVYHLWWHPHNFGLHLASNLDLLRAVLDTFSELREREGMVSLSMAGAADLARGSAQATRQATRGSLPTVD